ncbi:MAG: hypothetical protein ACOVP9_09180, partial [Flavobacterium stagni]
MNRRISEKTMVIDHYENYLKLKEEILKKQYAAYQSLYEDHFGKNAKYTLQTNDFRIRDLKEQLKRKKYEQRESKYMDEPFNTKIKKVKNEYKSSTEFLEAILNKE